MQVSLDKLLEGFEAVPLTWYFGARQKNNTDSVSMSEMYTSFQINIY
jgi:hypothetical protein